MQPNVLKLWFGWRFGGLGGTSTYKNKILSLNMKFFFLKNDILRVRSCGQSPHLTFQAVVYRVKCERKEAERRVEANPPLLRLCAGEGNSNRGASRVLSHVKPVLQNSPL